MATDASCDAYHDEATGDGTGGLHSGQSRDTGIVAHTVSMSQRHTTRQRHTTYDVVHGESVHAYAHSSHTLVLSGRIVVSGNIGSIGSIDGKPEQWRQGGSDVVEVLTAGDWTRGDSGDSSGSHSSGGYSIRDDTQALGCTQITANARRTCTTHPNN